MAGEWIGEKTSNNNERGLCLFRYLPQTIPLIIKPNLIEELDVRKAFDLMTPDSIKWWNDFFQNQVY